MDSELTLLCLVLSLFVLTALVSTIFALVLIRNLGLGAETKSKIMWRHLSIVFAFTLCNLFALYCIILIKTREGRPSGEQSAELISNKLVKLLQALFYSQGLILSLIRLLEPKSFHMYVRLAKNILTCKLKQDEDSACKTEPIRILFNSTLNIEFVYVLLEGIVKF